MTSWSWLLRFVLIQCCMGSAFLPPMWWMPVQRHGTVSSFFRLRPCFVVENSRADPSSEGEVEMLLRDRGITFNAEATEPTNPLPSFIEVWKLLRKELPDGGTNLLSADVVLNELTELLNEAYSGEIMFDEALFKAMKRYLKNYTIGQTDRNSIVLNLGNTQEYAVGVARQKSPALNLVQRDVFLDEDRKQYSFYTSTGMNANSTADHSVCLFHKNGEKWSVTDVFSLVELKTDASTCEGFDFGNNDAMLRPDLSKRHAALGQVTLYNLGLVLLYQAKRGVLASQIPLAIIACKTTKAQESGKAAQEREQEEAQKNQAITGKEGIEKSDAGYSNEEVGDTHDKEIKQNYAHSQGIEQSMGKEDMQKKLRWVSGTLEVPQACGGSFHYSVQEFGHVMNDDEFDESLEQASSLYINTIVSGLVAAIRVQKKLAAGEVPLASAASGRSLMIGDVTLDLEFCASPIPSAVVSQDRTANDNWRVSYGDLFKGKLDVDEVLQNSNRAGILDFRRGKGKKMGTSDVVVKVSSTAVHHHFIKPYEARLALERIKTAGKTLANEIGTVLYAVVPMGPNLVIVMNDLTKTGYDSLKPIHNSDQLDVLWRGFQDLVFRLLLPMARLGIIHANIRPGKDETSNIMCKLQTGKGKITKATMKLIDFENFIDYMNWDFLNVDRYIEKEKGWDAMTYVWWQCMAIAYAWKESLNASSITQDVDILKEVLLDGVDGPAWLNKYSDRAKGRITEKILQMTLADLAKEFATKEE